MNGTERRDYNHKEKNSMDTDTRIAATRLFGEYARRILLHQAHGEFDGLLNDFYATLGQINAFRSRLDDGVPVKDLKQEYSALVEKYPTLFRS